MDDTTRSIIRNVKGPGTSFRRILPSMFPLLLFLLLGHGEEEIVKMRRVAQASEMNENGEETYKWLTGETLWKQCVKMIFFVCWNRSGKPGG